MNKAQKKSQKVPTFSELAGNVNKLKRELISLESNLEERQANVQLLASNCIIRDRNYDLVSKLALSVSLNVALVGAIIIILGVLYV